MKLAIFFNASKAPIASIAADAQRFLSARGCTLFAEEENLRHIEALPLSNAIGKQIDAILSIGGDGTILRAVHAHPDIDAPIMAINLGSFGFMADTSASDIYPSLENLLTGSFTIQHRLMLEGFSSQNGHCYAINEIVFHRGLNHSLIDFAIYVDDIYLNTFSADGVIISTPTGSTAYSLSAGGPILTPELQVLLLTPISAHTISNRPVVFMPKKHIRIQSLNHAKDVAVTADGYSTCPLASSDFYTITPSQKTFRLITQFGHNYPSILREKLGWARKLKS